MKIRVIAFLLLVALFMGSHEARAVSFFEPDEFRMAVIEMGLLKSNPGTPDADTPLDFSSAVKVYQSQSSSGDEVIVRNGVSTSLPGTITRPPDGTYSYGYVVIAPVFKVKATYVYGGTTYYSLESEKFLWESGESIVGNQASRVATSDASWGLATIKMNAFNTESAYTGNRCISTEGGVSAYLTDSSYKLGANANGTGAGSYGTISRLVGIMPLNVTVDATTTTMDLAFKVTEGCSVYSGSITGAVDTVWFFAPGPFNINLSLP